MTETQIATISAIASVLGAAISWYNEYKLSKQSRQEKSNQKWQDIIECLDKLVELCADYWIIVGRAKEEKEIKANQITYQCKKISSHFTIIDKKYKNLVTGNLVEYIQDFNNVQTEATGGCFQTTMLKSDSKRVQEVQNKVSFLKEKIMIEIK